MSGQTAERRIPARFLLEETEQGFRLTLSSEDGTRSSKDFLAEHQPARTDQTASIREVLSKLGDTPYVCKDIEIRFSQPWFIPRSMLAEWRRECLQAAAPIQLPQGEENEKTEKKPQVSPQEYLEGSDPLMTCRFCLRHAWGWCKKENPDAPHDPLFLVLGDGRRFRLEFDCKKCEMKVLAP